MSLPITLKIKPFFSLQDLHADVMLNGLILGESLLNDAVAIVLCDSIEEYSKISLSHEDISEPNALLMTILRFFTITFGSVALGAFIGAMTALMTKFTHVKDFPLLETSLFFLMSYSSYLLAEICSMSGIVSVLFCGIFQVSSSICLIKREIRTVFPI